MLLEKKKEKQVTVQMPDLCRQRLLGYATTFKELSESLHKDFIYEGSDRKGVLDAQKYWESRQIICSNLEEISQIMENVAGEVFTYQPMEDRKKKMLIHALHAEGILAKDLCYIPSEEKRTISITMCTEKKGCRSTNEVAEILSVLFKKPFVPSATSPYQVDEVLRHFLFVTKADYIALTGYAKATKEGETVSGDNYSLLKTEQGKLIMILSDGTGSGKQACKNSEQVLDLMEKMLEAGYRMETAISLLNSALTTGGEEQNYPTLDICDIDLYDGGCEFYKVGGASSFLKGEHAVELLAGGTLPLGVFRTVQLKQEKRTLQNGDFIVMLTDGVLDALGEQDYEEAVRTLLTESRDVNPTVIAERLLKLAIMESKGHIRDDMTVLVAGIWENHQDKEV